MEDGDFYLVKDGDDIFEVDEDDYDDGYSYIDIRFYEEFEEEIMEKINPILEKYNLEIIER